MPHLRYAGKLWHIAGDDLSIPALCSITGRIVWTVLICILYGITSKHFHDCSTAWVFDLYFSISIFIFVLSILNDGSLIKVSLKGTMTMMDERKSIGNNLTAKFILVLFQIVCAIFGLITIIVDTNFPCSNDLNDIQITRIFVLIVCISQIVDASLLFCCCYCLHKREDISERIEYENNYENLSTNLVEEQNPLSNDQIISDTYNETWTIDLWVNKCKKITKIISLVSCGLFGGGNIDDGLEEVAKVLTLFFHYDGFLDVVPSDVIAGITLVRIQQRALKDTFKLKLAKNKSYTNGKVSLKLIENPNKDNFNTTYNDVSDESCYYKSNLVDDIENNLNEDNLENGSFRYSPLSEDEKKGFDLSADEFDNWLRCSVYSLAMYTHFIVLFMNPCTGLCNLCMNGILKDCCNCNAFNNYRSSSNASSLSRQVFIEGDNCCKFNNAGLNIIKNNLDNSDLIYVSFKNDTTHKPYAIFLDHDKKWVVISIRGTLSLEDCVTDAICEPVELKEAGEQYGFDGENRWAHGGMLIGALHIRKELERTGILKRVLGNGNRPYQEQPNSASPNTFCYSDYSLVVTGHSLGAGTAILLSLLLHDQYPSVRCYSLGTPASVLDERTSREVSTYIASLVLGNDLVCRLNFGALCELRHNILDAISRAKVNKMKILRSAIFNEYIDPDDYLYPAQLEPDTMFKRSVQTFSSVINKRLAVNSGKELRIPGYIVHLTKRSHIEFKDKSKYITHSAVSTLHASSTASSTSKQSFSTFFSKNILRPKRNDSDDLSEPTSRESDSIFYGDYIPVEKNLDDFIHIIVSTSMTVDHLPDRYYYEIKKIRDKLFQKYKK